jgi:hypothetical protein
MTPDPRIMLTFVYFPKYWRCRAKITLPMEARKVVENWGHVDLVTETEFKEDEIDYLGLEFQTNWYQTDNGVVGGGANGVVRGMGRRLSRK